MTGSLHPRGPRTDRALRGRLLRKLLEQIRSRHRRLSTSNPIAGNQISVETATGKNSPPLSYETIRQWGLKFGQEFANIVRRRLPRPGDKWHMDEVVIKIAGKTHYLWR